MVYNFIFKLYFMNFMGAVLLCASTENVAPIE